MNVVLMATFSHLLEALQSCKKEKSDLQAFDISFKYSYKRFDSVQSQHSSKEAFQVMLSKIKRAKTAPWTYIQGACGWQALYLYVYKNS